MKKAEIRDLYRMMFSEYPDIVSIAQLQNMLGISRHTALDLIHEGQIHALKLGKGFKIPKVSVINYVMTEKENFSNEQPTVSH